MQPTFANINGQNTGSVVPLSDFQMTPAEMSGGAAGVNSYNARVAAAHPDLSAPKTVNTSENGASATYGSVSPTSSAQPPTEPAVITSSNIDDNVLPKNADTLNNYDTGGLTVGDDNLARYGDGSFASAPSGAVQNPNDGSWSANGITYAMGPNTSTDPDIQSMYDSINQLKGQLDSNTLSSINNIESQYQNLIGSQTAANTNSTTAARNALLLSGASRYEPVGAAGQVTASMSAGISSIADLQTKENAAITAAKQAQESGDQQLLDQQLGIAQSVRTAKQAAAQKLSDTLTAAKTAQQSAAKQSSVDTAIADEIAKGNTDPASILANLNASGAGATAAQVAATLKDIATNVGAPDTSALTGDVKNFVALQQIPGGLPASILAMPQDQQLAAYIAMVHQAQKGIVNAKPVAGAAITGTGSTTSLTDPSGTPVSVQMTSDGAPDPQSQGTFLASLPGGPAGDEATLIKGLADYSLNPSVVPQKQYKGVAGLTQAQAVTLAKQYDPTYDQNAYATRAAMMKNINSGPYSVTINSANTLIQHLAQLAKDAAALPGGHGGTGSAGQASGNRSIPFINGIQNAFSSATGNASVNNFKTDLQAVASEAAKVYKGAAPTEGEISEQAGNIGPDSSNEQIQGYISHVIDLMTGRLSTLGSNYSSVMGKPISGINILTPASIAVLNNMGIDPSTIDPTYDSNSDPGGSDSDSVLNVFSGGGNAGAPSAASDSSSFFSGATI